MSASTLSPASAPEQPLKLKGVWTAVTVLAVLVVVVSVLTGFFLVRLADARTQDRLVVQQTLEANLWARMLNARMEAHQRLLMSIAEGMHSSLLDKPAVLDALMQQDGSMLRLFESLHVALSSGTITHHGALGAVAEINTIGIASLRRTIVEGKPSVTFLNAVDDLQHLSVLLSVPMRQADGRVAGALAAKVKLPIAALMPEAGQGKDNVQYVLLDSDGAVLAHSDMTQSQWHADALFAGHLAQWQALSQPSTANADTRVWGRTLATRVGLPLPQWQAVIVRDMAPDRLLAGGLPLHMVLAWLAASTLLMLLAGWALWHSWRVYRTQGDAAAEMSQAQHLALATPHADVWEAVPVAMLIEQGGAIRTMTPQARTLLGYWHEDAPPIGMEQLVDPAQALLAARRALVNMGSFEGVLILRKKDGDPARMKVHAWACAQLADATVWRLQLPWQVQLAKPLPDKEHVWRDHLTELPNRDAFMWALQSWVSDSMHPGKEDTEGFERTPSQGCVLFADLDHLGMINEVTSREMGNKLLQHVGRLMADYTQPLGQVARLGGDEFAMLLPGVSLAHAQGIAQALCDAVWRWQPHWGGERHWVSISMGVVAMDAQRHTPQQALRAADMACYEAKRRGRCQVAVGQISAQPILQA